MCIIWDIRNTRRTHNLDSFIREYMMRIAGDMCRGGSGDEQGKLTSMMPLPVLIVAAYLPLAQLRRSLV
jgi:hypothetical protein